MVNINGTLIPEDKATLSINNRAYSYGDGLFETIKAVNGRLFFWEDHYFRLMASMRIMRMQIPMEFTMEFLEKQIRDTLIANDLDTKSARVRLQVDRGGWRFIPTRFQIKNWFCY